MTFKKSLWVILLLLLLTACSNKTYTKQESVFIVFKTPTFKHADLGFIYANSDEVKVELYGSGQALVSLEISKRLVCMSFLECMGKKSFNKKILSSHYPASLIDNVFRSRTIFGAVGYKKKRNGFTQVIRKANNYDIEYAVLNNIITFHDKINNIVIKVKRMQG